MYLKRDPCIIQELNKEEELLEWEPSQFPVLQEMIAYKEPYDKLWRTAFNFYNKHEHWLNGKFASYRFSGIRWYILLIENSSREKHLANGCDGALIHHLLDTSYLPRYCTT